MWNWKNQGSGEKFYNMSQNWGNPTTHPIKTDEYILMLSSPHDSPFILVTADARSVGNSQLSCSICVYCQKRLHKNVAFSRNKQFRATVIIDINGKSIVHVVTNYI